MSRRIGLAVHPVASLIFPAFCPICGATDDLVSTPWCCACDRRVRLWDKSICPQCRVYRQPDEDPCPGGHGQCRPSHVTALGAYDSALGPVVRSLKYDGCRSLARPLGWLLAARFGRDDLDGIVAVPTAPRKKRERGFGHAEEIARNLSRHLQRPYWEEALVLTRRTADQTHLSPSQRQANMRGAFAVEGAARFAGLRVLMVDDVMTTGATMLEAAEVLAAAGARTVSGAVVALNVGATGSDR